MTIALDDFMQLQRDVQQLQQNHDKAAGALDQLMKQLRKEHGCKTLKEGRTLLEKAITERQEIYEKYVAAKAEFQTKWADQLGKK